MTIQTYHGDHWNTVATFDDAVVDINVIKTCALHIGDQFQYNTCFVQDVAVVDETTGEVLWNYADCVAGGWNAEIEDWHDDCDNDCGFDPYLGCFTDDC